MKLLGVAAAVAAGCAEGLYSSSSPVSVIPGEEFLQLKNSGKPFVAEFYSDGCGHCRNFAPEYEKAAGALKDIVQVVGVEDQSVMGGEAIKGFPTVKFYAGKTVSEYQGKRTADALVEFVMKQISALATKRLGGKEKDGGKENKKSEGKSEGKGEGKMVTLTDKDFEARVAKEGGDDVWFVLFYAPWCGHCKAMMPDWELAAKRAPKKVKFAKVDAQQNGMLAQHFGVQGFPTVKLFPPGGDRRWTALPNLAVPYEGERKADAFVAFSSQFAMASTEVTQLLSQEQYEEECAKGVCLIAFLPHILDSQASGRNASLKILKGVLQASYSMPVKFFWSEGGEQFDFEEKLRLQFGFPAVVALNNEKDRYAVHKGTFQEDSLRSFITSLMAGKQVVEPLPKDLPALKKVTAWDGKDAAAPEEDDEL